MRAEGRLRELQNNFRNVSEGIVADAKRKIDRLAERAERLNEAQTL